MPRTIPSQLLTDLRSPATTMGFLLRIEPRTQSPFGLASGNADITYDDGNGPLTYRCASGFTPSDVVTKADLSVNNAEVESLIAQYPLDGVTMDAILRGDYDGARFAQYLVNYNRLTPGLHSILSAGTIGQISRVDDLACRIELRSLLQLLKQTSMVELTSLSCRAKFGDSQCKLPLFWYTGTVASAGDEADRTFVASNVPGFEDPPGGSTGTVTDQAFFTGDGVTVNAQLKDTAGQSVFSGFTVSAVKVNGTALTAGTDYSVSTSGLVTFTTAPAANDVATWSGTLPLYPDGYFVPGVLVWLTGDNAGMETEIEEYVAASGTITLVFPMPSVIAAGDTFKLRRDCAKSKTACIAYGNIVNMRAEPEIPVGNGGDLQSPTPPSDT